MDAKPKKIPLDTDYYKKPAYRKVIPIRESLPFYKGMRGIYVHRVRAIGLHTWAAEHGWRPHTSVTFWCGSSGFLDGKGALQADLNPGDILCATCEGRAIGAGDTDDGRQINGRPVLFRPRGKVNA